MRKIELPSEALAKELQRHLQEKKFTVYERTSETIQLPDEMKSLEWSILKGAVEKWAKGRQLRVVESLTLQSLQPTKIESKEKEGESMDELRKRVDSLTPQAAEQRYNYLQSKPIGELTDAEYDERLELAQWDFKKGRKPGR